MFKFCTDRAKLSRIGSKGGSFGGLGLWVLGAQLDLKEMGFESEDQ